MNNLSRTVASVVFATLTFVFVTKSVLAQDPVTGDSKHYKVDFENDQVRVIRINVGPHEKSVMHEHPASVAVFLTDGKAKFTYPDGKTEEVSWKAGQTLWLPAVKHLPENLSDKPFELLQIELKVKEAKAEKK